LGTDKFGWGYGGTGKKSNARQFDNYGEAFGLNDVIGCFLDLDNGEIRYWKNGVDLGPAFTLNSQQKSEAFFPAVVLKNAEVSFNFGAQTFKYPPSSDYVAVCKASKDRVLINPHSKSQTQPGSTMQQTKNAPQAIIIEPSLELAEQTYNQIEKVK
jgi:ATP-dependent RNA helicase DDX1